MIHGVLGRGGFATVFKVEMLVPFGLEVGLIFNEERLVAVPRSVDLAPSGPQSEHLLFSGCRLQ